MKDNSVNEEEAREHILRLIEENWKILIKDIMLEGYTLFSEPFLINFEPRWCKSGLFLLPAWRWSWNTKLLDN